MTLGRSPIISRVLLSGPLSERGIKIPTIRFDDEINSLMYKMPYPREETELNEETRLKEIETLIQKYQPHLERGKKIMVVDEFIDGATKAIVVLARLSQLGFSDVSLSVFSGKPELDFANPNFINTKIDEINARCGWFLQASGAIRSGAIKVDYGQAVFIASHDPELQAYLANLAKFVSATRYELYDNPLLVPFSTSRKWVQASVAELLRAVSRSSRDLSKAT